MTIFYEQGTSTNISCWVGYGNVTCLLNLFQDVALLEVVSVNSIPANWEVSRSGGFVDPSRPGFGNHCAWDSMIGKIQVIYLMLQVVRNVNSSEGWTLAAVGFTQAGGIRSSIDTRTNIYENGLVLFYTNTIF